MINQFNNVKLKSKKITYDLSLPFSNRKKRPTFKSINTTFPSNLYPIRLYSENGQIFVYCSNKKTYRLYNGEFVEMEIDATTEPVLITVSVDGVNTVIRAPFGKDALMLNGRLIIRDDKSVYISKKLELSSYDVTEKDFMIIKLPDSEGKIHGILKSGENLLVLTERSLFKISRIDNDITVKRVSTPSFNVEKNTFARCGNNGCFVSGDKLFIIKNDKIVIKTCALDGIYFTIADSAGTAQNNYLLPVFIGGSKQMLLYDLESDESQLISENFSALSKENGYVIGNGLIKKFKYEYYDAGVLGASQDPEDMGTCKPKTITEIEACVKGTTTLRISGDFGEKDLYLKEGCNVFMVNVTSKRFTFNKIFSSNDFYLEEITLKYVVHEDSKNAI